MEIIKKKQRNNNPDLMSSLTLRQSYGIWKKFNVFFYSCFHTIYKTNIIRTYYFDLILMMPIERSVNYLNRWEAVFINCNRMTTICLAFHSLIDIYPWKSIHYAGHVFYQRLEKSVRPKLTMVLTIWMEWNQLPKWILNKRHSLSNSSSKIFPYY